MENQNTNPVPVPQPETKKWYKHKGLVAILVLLVIVSLLIWYPFHKQPNSQNGLLGGIADNPSPNDPLIGKTVSFDKPLLYIQDCTGCGGSPKELEINRSLQCPDDSVNLGGYLFKNGYEDVTYVPSSMKFTVQQVFKPHSYGVSSIDSGPGDYREVVLKDQNGVLSTALGAEIDLGMCINPIKGYLDKLFRYTETSGKAHIFVALYDLSNSKSYSGLQDKLVHSLPSKYSFSNITKVGSTPVPGLLGVEMDVDPDALMYLHAAKLDLNIWTVGGLDSAYQSSLSSDEQSQMTSAPLNFK